MKKEELTKKISRIKKNIDYYSRVYNPNSKKVKELRNQFKKLMKEENLVK